MNKQKKGSRFLLLAIIAALGMLLGGCGVESPTGGSVQTKAGVVTVGTPTAGLNICVACHLLTAEEWMTTRHANVSPDGNLYSVGSPTLGQLSTCLRRCHDITGDGAANLFTPGVTGYVARPVVGCEACHSGGQMHADAGGVGPIGYTSQTPSVLGAVPVSGQFMTCTYCHELLNAAGTGTAAPNAPAFHLSSAGLNIHDSHFATPGDYSGNYDGSTGGNVKNVTGYAMDYASEKVCTNCHNPHRNAEINREWAASAHADKFAGYNGDPTTEDPLGYFSSAWAHYDWSSRGSCQRCHTTTGFSAYADALGSNDLARAAGISAGTIKVLATATTPSWKPEMLQCWGCHADNKGTLRNPGPITANYNYVSSGTTYAIASFAYPDVEGSNVCMACHTGRESGDTVMDLNAPGRPVFDFSKNGFINSHYLTAGGTIFRATGFEFDGRSYENLGTYRHVKIGSSAEPNTGTQGPCIGCHMSRSGKSGNHLFLPVTRSTSTVTPGHIDGIASEICINCHTESGFGGLADLINERKEEYREAIEATIYVLDKRGIYFRPASPYFFELRTNTGTATVVLNDPAVSLPTNATAIKDVGNSFSPDYFKINTDGKYYRIRSAASATSITLDEPYTGTTVGAGLDYTIIRLSTNTIRTQGSPTYTAVVTQGSPTVTIAGVLYTSGTTTICAVTCSSSRPDYFKAVGLDPIYKIAAVTESGGNSILKIEPPYIDADNAAASYIIFRTSDSGLRDWRTKSGTGIVPAAVSDTDILGHTTGKYNMGAAFNLNLLEHDPGGYVHNRIYAKRLMYDAIDWADDNRMNYSVGNSLNGISPAYPWKAAAIKYLLPYGVLGYGAERP